MRIAYHNYLKNAVLSSNTEHPNFPVSNLKIRSLETTFRTTGTTLTLVMDLGAAKAINIFLIGSHNFTGSATVTLEANSADSWGPPAFTTTITDRSDIIAHTLSSTQTYRYWRLSVSDASNADGYIEIARPTPDSYFQVPAVERQRPTDESDTQRIITPGGRVYANVGRTYQSIEVQFGGYLTVTEREDFRDMWRFIGTGFPIFLIQHEDDLATYPALHVVLDGNLSWNTDQFDRSGVTLKFLEVR